MTRIRMDYADLLGVPHLPGALELRMGALDCAGVTSEVIRRALGEDARDAFLGLLRGEGSAWSEVTRGSLRLGDVVESEVGLRDPHVGAIVSTAPLVVLTSAKRLGVFACRLSTVARVRRFLRYPGEQT